MELFGGLPLPLGLAMLALIDSLSIGTLLIPLFLLLNPGRVRVRRILLYLATIAGFYLVVGLLFFWGIVNVADVAADFLSSPTGAVVRLVVGAGLLAASFLVPASKKPGDEGVTEPSADAFSTLDDSVGSASLHHGSGSAHDGSGSAHDGSAAQRHGSATKPRSTPLHPPQPVDASPSAAPTTAPARPGRLSRWRARLLDPATRGTAVMIVAVAAGIVEVATMLPYIMAMSALGGAGLSMPASAITLVAYCLVMIVPALLLLVARLVAAPLVTKPLARLAAWMERTGAETTAWIVGIIGFLILRSAATDLRLFDMIGDALDRL